jgi:hypothetical protein
VLRDNAPLDIDLSDIDFDDDEEENVSPTVDTPSPVTAGPDAIHIKLSNLHKTAPEKAAARSIAKKLEDALLPYMDMDEVDRLSELEVASLVARQYLEEASAEASPEPAVVDAARALYIKRLREQLDYAAYLKMRYAEFLPSASAGLQRVSSDPLLSKEDVAEINRARPTVTNQRGEKVGFIPKKKLRQGIVTDITDDAPYLSIPQIAERGRLLKQLASGLKLPEGWKVDAPDEAEMEKISKLPSRAARAAAYKAIALKSKPRHVVIRPTQPGLDKHSILLEANPEATKLIPSQKEVDAVLDGFKEFTDVFDITSLQTLRDNSELSRYNKKDGALEIVVGTHVGAQYFLAQVATMPGTNGVYSPNGQIFINLGNIKNYDDPKYMQDNNLAGHFVFDPKDALDKLTTTTIHELGHFVDSAMSSEIEMDKGREAGSSVMGPDEVSTRYAASKGAEQVAEAILFYVRTGKISQRLKQKMVQYGLLPN